VRLSVHTNKPCAEQNLGHDKINNSIIDVNFSLVDVNLSHVQLNMRPVNVNMR
jgi:hypothetical protein